MTAFTDEVRETVSPYKFGGSRRAAALYLLSLEGSWLDGETGTVEWDVWCGRRGRTLLLEDGQGFVWAMRYPTEEEAVADFNRIDAAYSQWWIAQGEDL